MTKPVTADVALLVARTAARECVEDETNGPQWQLLLAFEQLDKLLSSGGELPAAWQSTNWPVQGDGEHIDDHNADMEHAMFGEQDADLAEEER